MADEPSGTWGANPDTDVSGRRGSRKSKHTRRPGMENAIREIRQRKRSNAAAPEPNAAPAAAAEGADASRGDAGSARPGIPEAISRRFVQVGPRYYFSDGTVAFTDRGTRLTTASENRELVGTLVTIAKTRGWAEIGVSGSERFRQEAWLAGSAAGLTVRGHKPTEFEQAQLARRLARDRGAEAERQPEAAPAAEFAGEEKKRPKRREQGSRDELLTGRLLEHGRAPYRQDPKEAMSYYVKVETGKGARTVWGVDLERALKESVTAPRTGDQVALRSARREAVTVKRPERDEAGETVGTQDLGTHRNRWVIEKPEFFEARASAAAAVRDPSREPRRVVRDQPELVGAYLSLRGAEEIAKRAIPNEEDRKKFMSVMRETLASRIEKGERMPTVRVRTREATRHSSPGLERER